MSQGRERDLLTALRYRQVRPERDDSVSDAAGRPVLLSLLGGNQAVGSLLGRAVQRCGPDHPDCGCQMETRAEAAGARSGVGGPLSPSMVTQLQRLAGNTAVARLLQRNDKQSEESGDEATEESGDTCGFEVGGLDEDSMVAQGSSSTRRCPASVCTTAMRRSCATGREDSGSIWARPRAILAIWPPAPRSMSFPT
jgi:hypothetical protein